MKSDRLSGKATVIIVVLIPLLPGHKSVLAESPRALEVGLFSGEKADKSLRANWEPFYFKNIQQHAVYRLVVADGRVVLKPTADASTWGLTRKIAIDSEEYPIIQ